MPIIVINHKILCYFCCKVTNVSTCLVYRNALIRHHLSSLFNTSNGLLKRKLKRLKHFSSSHFIYSHYAALTQRGQGVDIDHRLPEYSKSMTFVTLYFIIAIENQQVKRNHLLISYFSLVKLIHLDKDE